MNIDDLKQLCKKDGYVLEEYNSAKDVVISDCDGYLYNTSVSAIKSGRGHNILQKNRYALQNLKIYTEKKTCGTFHVIDDTYVNCKTKVKCICDKHNESVKLLTPQQIINTENLCDECYSETRGIKYRIPTDELKAIVMGYDCEFQYADTHNGDTTIFFTCNKHKDIGVQSISLNNLRRNKRICKRCMGRGRTNEVFQNDVYERHPNIKILSDYSGYESSVVCYCCVCNTIWATRAGQLLSDRQRGCPNCGRLRAAEKRASTHEQFVKKMAIINESIDIIGDYSRSHDYIKCKCKKHGNVFDVIACNLLNGSATCPLCASYISRMEKRIGEILKENGLLYCHQYSFDDCRGDKRKLRFDYYIPDHRVVIEYDGQQHFMPVDYFGGVDAFYKRKTYDCIKDAYCENNNITMIRVPYFITESIDTYLISQLKQIDVLTP